MITRACHRTVPSNMNSIYSFSICLFKSVLMLSYHLHRGFSRTSFPPCFPTNILYESPISYTCCMSRPSLLDHSHITFGEKYNYGSSHRAGFSSLLPLLFLGPDIPLNTPLSNNLNLFSVLA